MVSNFDLQCFSRSLIVNCGQPFTCAGGQIRRGGNLFPFLKKRGLEPILKNVKFKTVALVAVLQNGGFLS